MSIRKVVAAGALLSSIGMISDDFSETANAATNTHDLLTPYDPVTMSRVKEVPLRANALQQKKVVPLQTLEVEEKPAFIIYKVKKGDTLSHIAKHFDVKVEQLVEMNQIKNPNKISIGQELHIPALTTESYVVKGEDTLQSIAFEKGITIQELVENNTHILKRFPDMGHVLQIPHAKPEPILYGSKKGKSVQVASTSSKSVKLKDYGATSSTTSSATTTVTLTPSTQSTTTSRVEEIPAFSWPIKDYKVTSKFGMRWGRHHNGIDLVSNDGGKEVYAAKSGTVIASLFSRGGLGNLIIIDHGNGVETYYAHLKDRLVNEGDLVQAGDLIGKMGDTGRSTGVHLHFEVRKDNKPLNPLDYLAKGI